MHICPFLLVCVAGAVGVVTSRCRAVICGCGHEPGPDGELGVVAVR